MYVQNSGKGMRVLCPKEKVHCFSQMLKGTVCPPDFRSAIPEVGDEMTWARGVGSDAEVKAGSRGSWWFKGDCSVPRPALGLFGTRELKN